MKKWSVFFFSIFITTVTVVALRQAVIAEEAVVDPWFHSNLVVERAPDAIPTGQTYFNAPCEKTTSKTFTPGEWGSYSYGTIEECVHKADYGFLSSNRLKLNGTEMAYELRDTTGAYANLNPIAYTNNGFRLLQAGGASSTHHLYIYDDIPGNLKVNKFLSLGRPARYQLTNSSTDESNVIRNNKNQKIAVYAETIGYSTGGRFMVADSGYVQNLINTQTKKSRQFGQPTYRSGGLTPNTKLIVDATGDKVLVFDNEQRTQRLYNLDDCTIDDPSGVKETCQSVDLTPLLTQATGGQRGYGKARFISKNTLELFVGEVVDGKILYKRYFVHPENSQANSFEYLALGDSFTSGEGAYNYKYPTDTPDNRCHLSHDSYPYLIKKQLGLTTAESVACSGAKMKDIWFHDEDKYNKDEKQSRGKEDPIFNKEIEDSFGVGYRMQQTFLSKNNPTIVTASIGGNDIGFGSKIRKCVFQPGNCFNSREEKSKIFQEIRGQFADLVTTYKKLKEANEDTRIYIIGYPQVATPIKDTCGANVHLSTEEIILSNQIVTDLNTTIEAAAKKVGLRYVDVSDAFAGHRLCEVPNWDLAMNGLTAGNDAVPIIGYPIGKESFHPNNYGHELYKNKILSETNYFTQMLPAADDTIDEELITSTLDPVYSYNSSVPTAKYNANISNDTVKPGESFQTKIATNGIYMNQGDTFTVEIHSTPEVAGTATASSMGELNIDVEVPDNVAPGLHEFHILVPDVEGKKYDFYKDVFVVLEGDIDGDGILDEQDKCYLVDQVNIDEDKDDIDDACDGFIAKPPVDIATPESGTEEMINDTGDMVVTPRDNSNSTASPTAKSQVIDNLVSTRSLSQEHPVPQKTLSADLDDTPTDTKQVAEKPVGVKGVVNVGKNSNELTKTSTTMGRLVIISLASFLVLIFYITLKTSLKERRLPFDRK